MGYVTYMGYVEKVARFAYEQQQKFKSKTSKRKVMLPRLCP